MKSYIIVVDDFSVISGKSERYHLKYYVWQKRDSFVGLCYYWIG